VQEWTGLLGQAGLQNVLVERGEIDFDPTSKVRASANWLPTFARKS
jgi:hypothetical protein